MRIDVLNEAAKDFRFLLSRGYNRESILKPVGDKYRLDRLERHILYRSIYQPEIIPSITGKLIYLEDASDKELGIDGFNQIITIESILKGKIVILCDDGIIRDVSAIFEKFKVTETTFTALKLIFEALSKNTPKQTCIYFDSPISKSGEIASLVNDYLKNYNIPGSALTARNVDEAILTKEVVASSDHIIITRAERILDLPRVFLPLYRGEVLSLK